MSATQEAAPPKPATRLTRNIARLGGGQLATWSMSIAAMLIVPRALGPSQMGVLTAATSVTSVIALIAGFVTADFLVREMVVRRADAAHIAGTALLLRALTVPVFLAVVWIYVRATAVHHRDAPIFFLLAAATVTYLLVDPLQAGFKSIERMEYVALSDLIIHSSAGVVAVTLVLLGSRAEGLAAGAAAVGVFTLFVNARWARRLHLVTFHRCRDEAWLLTARGLPFWPLQLAAVVYLYIDSVVLSIIQRSEVVGWYGVATRLFGTLLFIPTILATAWYPRLVAAFERSPDEFRRDASSFVAIIPALSFPVAAVTAITAGPLIRLVYGPAYSGAITVLVALGLCAIPMYLGIALGQVLIAAKRPATLTLLLLGGVVVNVGLNLLLVPLFADRYSNGALGSAVSLLLTELLISGGQMLVVGRSLIDGTTFNRAKRSAVASMAMGLVFVIANPLGLIAVPLALASLAPASLVCGVLSPPERAAVWRGVNDGLRHVRRRLVPR